MRRSVITMRAAAALLAGGLIISLMVPQLASATTQMTATVGVNIRSGAGTDTKILGGLYRGQTVTAVSSTQGWTKIKFGGSTAYVLVDRPSRRNSSVDPGSIRVGRPACGSTSLDV